MKPLFGPLSERPSPISSSSLFCELLFYAYLRNMAIISFSHLGECVSHRELWAGAQWDPCLDIFPHFLNSNWLRNCAHWAPISSAAGSQCYGLPCSSGSFFSCGKRFGGRVKICNLMSAALSCPALNPSFPPTTFFQPPIKNTSRCRNPLSTEGTEMAQIPAVGWIKHGNTKDSLKWKLKDGPWIAHSGKMVQE